MYILQHVISYENGLENVKFIGVYSTRENALAAIERLSHRPGFMEAIEGFYIDEYTIDKDHWVEGFVC